MSKEVTGKVVVIKEAMNKEPIGKEIKATTGKRVTGRVVIIKTGHRRTGVETRISKGPITGNNKVEEIIQTGTSKGRRRIVPAIPINRDLITGAEGIIQTGTHKDGHHFKGKRKKHNRRYD